jgi:hypothetical protein
MFKGEQLTWGGRRSLFKREVLASPVLCSARWSNDLCPFLLTWHDLRPTLLEQRVPKGSLKTRSRENNSIGVEEGRCSSFKLLGPEHDAPVRLSNDVPLPAGMACFWAKAS